MGRLISDGLIRLASEVERALAPGSERRMLLVGRANAFVPRAVCAAGGGGVTSWLIETGRAPAEGCTKVPLVLGISPN